MLFNSLQFAIFFPLAVFVYFSLPQKNRWVWLLLSSCYFYMAFVPAYILILFAIILIDYYAAILIELQTGYRRKLFLIFSLCANIAILASFKYWNFIAQNVQSLFALIGWPADVPQIEWLLPIGLSFHTFQSMGYTIEVYKGRQAAERHLGIYANYVLFFPQMVAGPIERPQALLHQFTEKHSISYGGLSSGLKLIGLGLFKKCVIADRLSGFVDQVYSSPSSFSPSLLLIATYFFAFQIYCDFSGYSEIAQGTARILGFRLMRNFEMPYLAGNIVSFWRRWHISLSSWFRDYLYVPLGGNRFGLQKQCFNLFVTFVLSGLWHGANWTFVIWGGINGAYLVSYVFLQRLLSHLRFPRIKRAGVVWGVLCSVFIFNLIALSWIFFRATTISDAFYIVAKLFSPWDAMFAWSDALQFSMTDFTLSIIFIVSLLLFEAASSRERMVFWFRRCPEILRWGCYYLLVILLLVFGKFENQNFIYFQF